MVRAPRARLAGVRRRPTRPSRPAPAPGIARHATESCRGTIAERTEIDGGAGLPASGSARPPARPRSVGAPPPPGAPAAHGVGTVAQPELGGVRLPRPRPTGPGHRRSAGARRSHADWDCDFRLVPHGVLFVRGCFVPRFTFRFRSFDEPGMYTIRDRIRIPPRAVPNQKCSWYNLPNKSCNRVDGVPTGNRYANGRGIFLFRVRYYRVDVRQSWFKDAVCVS